jgi:hypothetical protein
MAPHSSSTCRRHNVYAKSIGKTLHFGASYTATTFLKLINHLRISVMPFGDSGLAAQEHKDILICAPSDEISEELVSTAISKSKIDFTSSIAVPRLLANIGAPMPEKVA